MNIGEKIHQLRAQNEISMYRLAKELNISQSYLHDLESGKKSGLSIDKLQLICNFFGISLKDFFSESKLESISLTKRRIIKSVYLLDDEEAEVIWNLLELFLKNKDIDYLKHEF